MLNAVRMTATPRSLPFVTRRQTPLLQLNTARTAGARVPKSVPCVRQVTAVGQPRCYRSALACEFSRGNSMRSFIAAACITMLLASPPVSSHIHTEADGSTVSWYPHECGHDGDCR